jgi:guanine deaminase
MEDKDFMRLAIAKAKEGIKNRQTPFGACIVKNGKVISCEHNVVWKTKDSTMHAEMHAIRAACKKLKTIDLSGCKIYSTTEPCPMCFSAIHWAKIDKIVFGCRISDAAKAGFSELTISNKEMKKRGKSNVKVVADFLREENLELFKEFKKRDGSVY